MTAKEKAQQLVSKLRFAHCKFLETDKEPMLIITRMTEHDSKQCALIAVDEIINSESDMFDEIYINTDKGDYHKKSHRYAYWQEVKREIELL